jgi:hypothetical protein
MRRFIVALFAVTAIIVAPSASSEDAHAPPAPEGPTEQVRLTTRSFTGERFVPLNQRLGTFAIDLGLSLDGSWEELQLNEFMLSVFAGVAGDLTASKSNQRCRLVLLPNGSGPYVTGFLYKTNSNDPSEDARATCMSIVRNVLDHEIGSNTSLIGRLMQEWIARRRRGREETGADFARKFPRLAAESSTLEAIRRIYDPNSLVHALLSIDADRLSHLRADDFKRWLRRIREHTPVRPFSEDPQMWPILGVTAADQMPLLPALPTPKTRERVIKLPDIDIPPIRAAVLLAIDRSPGGKVRNDVTKKYCVFVDSTVAVTTEFPVRCDFLPSPGREIWMALYFDASDGPDDVLLDRVNKIASDPVVGELAARRRNGEIPGHPYVVLFGSPSN